MVKIQHKQTKEIREVARNTWETAKEYVDLRNLWLILDEGDPVKMIEINKLTGEHKEFGNFDRDHAERMVKMDSSQYYYKELNESSQSFLPNFESRNNSINLEKDKHKAQPIEEAKTTSENESIRDKIYKWTDHKLISMIIYGLLGLILLFFAKKTGFINYFSK